MADVDKGTNAVPDLAANLQRSLRESDLQRRIDAARTAQKAREDFADTCCGKCDGPCYGRSRAGELSMRCEHVEVRPFGYERAPTLWRCTACDLEFVPRLMPTVVRWDGALVTIGEPTCEIVVRHMLPTTPAVSFVNEEGESVIAQAMWERGMVRVFFDVPQTGTLVLYEVSEIVR